MSTMRSGYAVTIKGFIPVDPDNPDSVIAASEAVKILSGVSDEGHPAHIGEAYAALKPTTVKARFVNRKSADEQASSDDGE